MRCGGGFSISISISISTCPQWRELSTAIILHSYVTLRTGARFTQRPKYTFSLHQNKCDSDFYLNVVPACGVAVLGGCICIEAGVRTNDGSKLSWQPQTIHEAETIIYFGWIHWIH